MTAHTKTAKKTSGVGGAAHGDVGRVMPGTLFHNSNPQVIYRQHFIPNSCHLKYLTCGVFELAPHAESRPFRFAGEESLLFMWHGAAKVWMEDNCFELSSLDTLYVPRGIGFRVQNVSADPAQIVHCSAPSANEHPPFHSRFAQFANTEERIRRMKGRDVYMMFDVSEGADKLVAGYTFFQPHYRSWPPHNHTDQEEVYFFIRGQGSMEVYESPEQLSFVKEVREGDMVTIPMLNYHPVFTQESPLDFIWCIAGERYWVGDKNKAFMAGSGGPITT